MRWPWQKPAPFKLGSYTAHPSKALYHLQVMRNKLESLHMLRDIYDVESRAQKKALQRTINGRRKILLSMGFDVPPTLVEVKRILEQVA